MNKNTYAQLVTGTHPGYSVPPVDDLAARFAALGVVSTRPIIECRDARKRPGPATSYIVVLEKGARIPARAWDALETGAWCSGRCFVVQFRKVG